MGARETPVSFEPTALLPPTILVASACLFFLAGSYFRQKWLWGPACLAALAIAAVCLSAQPRTLTADAFQSEETANQTSQQVEASENDAGPAAPGGQLRTQLLSTPFQWICLAVGVLFTLSAFDTQRTAECASEYFGVLLLSVAGTMIVASADDLIIMFLAIELVAFASYVLLILSGDDSSSRNTASSYFLLSLLASALLLYGMCFLYGLSGSTNLAEIRQLLLDTHAPADSELTVGSGSRLGIVAVLLIFAGIGIRMSAMPFHFGTPDVYQGTTAWNVGFLSVMPKAVGFMVLIRLFTETLVGFEATCQLLTLVMAGVSMTIGSVLSLFQTNVRRLLAYSTMAHGGFVLVGIAIGFGEAARPESQLPVAAQFPDGITASFVYLGGYVLMTAGFSSVLVYLARKNRPVEYIDDLKGVVRSEPVAAVCAVVLLLGLAGIPPLAGFWGRLLLLSAALSVQIESTHTMGGGPNSAFVLLALIASLSMLLLATTYLRLVIALFLEGQVARQRPSGGQPALAAAVFATLIAIAVGLLPGPILGYLQQSQQPRRAEGALLRSNDSPHSNVLEATDAGRHANRHIR